MFRYGPLRQLWTMRFEGKHSYFKKLTQNLGNFINLPLTLARRHQKLQCYNAFDSTSYSTGLLNIGPGKVVASSCAPAEVARHGGDILRVNWVELNGVTYKTPCAFVTGMGLEHPEFAKLTDIFVVTSKRVIFCVQPLQTVEFCEHFHSFVVQNSPREPCVYVSPSSLLTFLPHHIRVLPGSMWSLCIVPRHHFVSNPE